MSAVGRFLQNPSQFLQSNVLVIAWDGNEQLADRVHDLTFVQKPPADAVARKMGETLGLYFVVPQQMLAAMPGVTPDGRTFRSYFCPYRQNDTLGCTISNDADFIFTATMDGCSLGIGSAGADGSRLIYHSNLAGQARKEGDPAQAAAQDTTINLLMPGKVDTIWTASNYRFEYGAATLSSTTFGTRSRTTNKWSFLSQVYFKDAGTRNPLKYFLREVKEVL